MRGGRRRGSEGGADQRSNFLVGVRNQPILGGRLAQLLLPLAFSYTWVRPWTGLYDWLFDSKGRTGRGGVAVFEDWLEASPGEPPDWSSGPRRHAHWPPRPVCAGRLAVAARPGIRVRWPQSESARSLFRGIRCLSLTSSIQQVKSVLSSSLVVFSFSQA